MKSRQGQPSVRAVTLGVLLTVMVALASADAPTVITPPPETFTDVDPCTGELHQVTISMIVYVHTGHSNNEVIHQERAGSTDSGYEMLAGQANAVLTNQVFRFQATDMWSNADGRMFQATGRFLLNLNTGEVIYDVFNLKCIGRETILP